MRFRVTDVETLPHPDAHTWVDAVKADSRLKDPAKIAASITEKTAERDERLGLDPYTNRIVALGFFDVGHGDPWCEICENEEEEASALTYFWATYRQQETRLVTFFGLSFDLPVLMMRSLCLGVKYPPLSLDRYRTTHLDICQKLSFNGTLKPHSLKFFCRRFGIQTNDPFDGSEVAQLAKEGRYDDIRNHCIADIGATHMLANRLGLLEIA